jgi:hypothetical protein
MQKCVLRAGSAPSGFDIGRRTSRCPGMEKCHPRPTKSLPTQVALDVGDHLMLLTIRRRSQVSLFLVRVGRTFTLDRRVNE